MAAPPRPEFVGKHSNSMACCLLACWPVGQTAMQTDSIFINWYEVGINWVFEISVIPPPWVLLEQRGGRGPREEGPPPHAGTNPPIPLVPHIHIEYAFICAACAINALDRPFVKRGEINIKKVWCM